jgi:type I restriction enzyme M protein
MLDDIKKTLWATADKLRANMDAAEYKHLVLGLIFVKYISDTFAARRAELTTRFADPADDYFLADSTPALLEGELEDRDYYREVNVFWVPEAARWEALRSAAKQPDIGKRIDDALSLVEAENPKLKGILDKRYARAQLPDGKLGELVDLVSTIGFGATPGEARDVLGQVYEYFLGMFASAEGKRGGQFYTPRSIVKTLVAVLAPHHGKVYDPCCGSGGMFVQSEEFIEAHGGRKGDVAIYGQEANPTTWRLAAMNLAIRGIDFNLGREPADTFTNDQFKDLRAVAGRQPVQHHRRAPHPPARHRAVRQRPAAGADRAEEPGRCERRCVEGLPADPDLQGTDRRDLPLQRGAGDLRRHRGAARLALGRRRALHGLAHDRRRETRPTRSSPTC